MTEPETCENLLKTWTWFKAFCRRRVQHNTGLLCGALWVFLAITRTILASFLHQVRTILQLPGRNRSAAGSARHVRPVSSHQTQDLRIGALRRRQQQAHRRVFTQTATVRPGGPKSIARCDDHVLLQP